MDLDETEYMSFLMKQKKCLEKYNKIREKVRNITKKLIVNLYIINSI